MDQHAKAWRIMQQHA